MKTSFPLSLLLLGAGSLLAQNSSTSSSSGAVHLEEFTVTGSPLGRAADEVAQPNSVLGGTRLIQARQSTLGETLASEPGVSSTYFGPGASRPVIRGLGGDRIRVLSSGIGTLDASVVSPDHAISVDPLLVDRIEIVRGPATLLYGGSAVGGVVNVIDSRIPEELPAKNLGGRFEARLGSAADERAGAGVLTGKAGSFAWRLDGFKRRTDDVRIPGFAETDELLAGHDEATEGPAARGHLPNSASETSGAGAGLTYVGQGGHIGVAYSGFDTLYGVPGHEHGGGEEAVRIDLRQRRWDVHGELLEPAAWLRLAKMQFGAGDYRHVELESADVGTRFTNRAYEGRLELLHRRAGPLEGAIGLQASRSDFAAAGDEAFLPPSVTTDHALFVYEEIPGESVTWQFGGRVGRQEIAPDGASGLSARSHTSTSLSGGVVWNLPGSFSVAASLTRSERAPNAQELFADGPHAGTGVYEVGDPTLGVERSTGFDLSLRKRSGRLTGSITVFANRFAGYIFEEDTGALDPDDGLPVYHFVQQDAKFAGTEVEVVLHLHESTGRRLDLRLKGDAVRATNRTTGEPLPRITPARFGWGVDFRSGGLILMAEMRQTGRQDGLAPAETATADFALVNLFASHRFKAGGTEIEFFARATNLGDRTARVHSSFLKDVAPLPGRDFAAGVRYEF